MKRIIAAVALFAVASLVTVTGVSAQEHPMKVTVPFDFTVGNQLLPPGTYRITTSASSHQVLIASRGRGISVLVLGSADDKSAGERAKVVFHKIGDQYFLNEIVSSAFNSSALLPPSKLETRAKMQNASLQSDVKTIIATK